MTVAVVWCPVGGAGQQFKDSAGNVLAGGKLYTYAAGTTTPLVTYTNAFATTPNPNPIVLGSDGTLPGGDLWIETAVLYKFVLTDSTGVNIGYWDNVTSLPSVTGATGAIGATGAAVNFKGAWSSTTSYAVNDVVSSGGSSYACILANTNNLPPNATYWAILVQAATPITWKGAWSSATAYVFNDGVNIAGASYACITANTNNQPPNATYWQLLAAAGTVGANGSNIAVSTTDSTTIAAALFIPNTITITNNYNANQGKTQVATTSDGYTITLAYDYAGRPAIAKTVVGGVTTHQRFKYDTIGRLISVTEY